MSYFINYKKPEHPLKLIDWLIKKIKMLQKISLPIKLPFLCLKCPWYLLQYVTYYIMKGFIEQHISLNVTLASCISWLALSLHTVELYNVHNILLLWLTWLSYWRNSQNNYFSFGFTGLFSHSFCHCCCPSHEVYSETCL